MRTKIELKNNIITLKSQFKESIPILFSINRIYLLNNLEFLF